jgi:hypothetical protein
LGEESELGNGICMALKDTTPLILKLIPMNDATLIRFRQMDGNHGPVPREIPINEHIFEMSRTRNDITRMANGFDKRRGRKSTENILKKDIRC